MKYTYSYQQFIKDFDLIAISFISILKATNGLIASKLIFTSKDSSIKNISVCNSLIDKTNVINKINIVDRELFKLQLLILKNWYSQKN